jgi:hypothetical protein
MGSNTYATLRTFGKNFYDEASYREIMTTGLFGHLWTADVRVIPHLGFSKVLILGKKNEKLVMKKNENPSSKWDKTIVDEEQTIERQAIEFAMPKNPLSVNYSFVPHQDAARAKHVFDARAEIGVRINDLTGVSVIELLKGRD